MYFWAVNLNQWHPLALRHILQGYVAQALSLRNKNARSVDRAFRKDSTTVTSALRQTDLQISPDRRRVTPQGGEPDVVGVIFNARDGRLLGVQSLRYFFLSQPRFFPCLSQDNTDLELGVAHFKCSGQKIGRAWRAGRWRVAGNQARSSSTITAKPVLVRNR